MTRRTLLTLSLCAALLSPEAFAAPRDAAAVLNRCGKPLKGEETILEDTVSGGRRILSYERGTLTFEKVANIGWTFAYGSHRKQDHLTAEQMEKYMPCLKDALADSAAPEPLVTITPVERAEVSVKRDFKVMIAYTLGFLVLLGIAFYIWSRRTREVETEEEALE
jgi:hypothetical protein